MAQIDIDQSKCRRDGICVKSCPRLLIRQDQKHTLPYSMENAAEYCIGCGHCVAICPQGALTHWLMSPNECRSRDELHLPDPAQVEALLATRRSVRKYRKEAIGRSQLEKLISAVRFAPSGHNRQPVRWLIVDGSEKVAAMAGLVTDWMRHLLNTKSPLANVFNLDRLVDAWDCGEDIICRGAPHLIVVYAPKEDPVAHHACIIALTYFELAAFAAGFGACWTGYLGAAIEEWKPLKDALGLSSEHRSYGAMVVGFGKYNFNRIPLRNAPKITWK